MNIHSIRFRFFAAISSVAVAFIGILLVLNLFFYDDYYAMTRRSELTATYQSVQRSYRHGTDGLAATLDALENSSAIRLGVVQSDGTVIYASSFNKEEDGSDSQTVPYFGFSGLFPDFSDQNLRSYAIMNAVFQNARWDKLGSGHQFLTVSLRGGDQYLCLAGRLADGVDAYLIAYMPYAVIEKNSSFNLSFLLIAGSCALLFCLIFGYFLSRQFIRPLITMADVADRMSELDFSTRYEGTERDELGQLGQAINRMAAYLEQAVSDLQQTNARLAEEVREKEHIDSMRRELIVNISHELKTPIALIQGYAEGLTAGVADTPEDRRYYCDTIADEAGHMNRLVMQLLSLSKLELGAEQTFYEEVDLYSLCREAVQKTAVLCAGRRLSVCYQDTQAAVRTDAGLLEQVLMNYLSNAIRYTADGGRIEITARRTEAGIRLAVFNEGDGLPEEELPKIWEKFYRTDRARSRENGGTGIGLSIVRAIADTLHGSCGADNVPGGISFWFSLPDAPEGEPEQEG